MSCQQWTLLGCIRPSEVPYHRKCRALHFCRVPGYSDGYNCVSKMYSWGARLINLVLRSQQNGQPWRCPNLNLVYLSQILSVVLTLKALSKLDLNLIVQSCEAKLFKETKGEFVKVIKANLKEAFQNCWLVTKEPIEIGNFWYIWKPVRKCCCRSWPYFRQSVPNRFYASSASKNMTITSNTKITRRKRLEMHLKLELSDELCWNTIFGFLQTFQINLTHMAYTKALLCRNFHYLWKDYLTSWIFSRLICYSISSRTLASAYKW